MRLDPLIHPPKRLATMALLAHASSTDFRFLKQHLDVSDSDLSKQLSALAGAGYLTISKTGAGRGSVTTLTITRTGAAAYRGHRQALQAMLTPVDTQATGSWAGADGGAAPDRGVPRPPSGSGRT